MINTRIRDISIQSIKLLGKIQTIKPPFFVLKKRSVDINKFGTLKQLIDLDAIPVPLSIKSVVTYERDSFSFNSSVSIQKKEDEYVNDEGETVDTSHQMNNVTSRTNTLSFDFVIKPEWISFFQILFELVEKDFSQLWTEWEVIFIDDHFFSFDKLFIKSIGLTNADKNAKICNISITLEKDYPISGKTKNKTVVKDTYTINKFF